MTVSLALRENQVCRKIGKFRWYRGTIRFRPYLFKDGNVFFYDRKGANNMKIIVFVGAGSMAEAVITGIIERGILLPSSIYVTNKSSDDKLQFLQKKYGISIVCKNKIAIKKADLVVLATKPKNIEDVMAEIKPFLTDETAILSVIAGISIDTIEKGLGERPIARSMPNTSATIGKSATGIAMNTAVDSELRNKILYLLESIGMVKVVTEDDLHAVTALSGSGPAYIYYLAEALEEAAIKLGLSKEIAKSLIIQTLEGAAAMLKETQGEPAELRKNVTSPGGTTEAGITALENGLFKEVVNDCIQKAEARSRELGKLS